MRRHIMAEKTEDLNLPLSVISRIIKEAMPEGVLVSKEARLAISRAASVFVLHATTYANQSALSHKRKTLTAADVLSGVKELELDAFVPPLQEALGEWRAAQKRKSDAKKANKVPGEEGEEDPEEALEEEEPTEKSARLEDDDSPPTLQPQEGEGEAPEESREPTEDEESD